MMSTKDTALKRQRKPKAEAAAKPKKKGGRPSKYDPALCERIVELGRKGKTKAQMAAALEISLSTFRAWMDAHPEFMGAFELADTFARAYFEEVPERGIALGQNVRAALRHRAQGHQGAAPGR